MTYKLTMVLRRESLDDAYTVRCLELPELITEGNTVDEGLGNAVDAFVSTLEIYEELAKELPAEIFLATSQTESPRFQTKTPDPEGNDSDLWFEATVPTPAVSPREGEGSHRKWINSQSNKAAILPFYKNREFTAWTVRDIVEQLGLDWDDFNSNQ